MKLKMLQYHNTSLESLSGAQRPPSRTGSEAQRSDRVRIDATNQQNRTPRKVTPAEVARLKALVQVHCGTADRHVPVADIRELEKMLRAQSTPVEIHLYEGADHGFLAYTRPFYKPDAAQLAWKRTTQFLQKHLYAEGIR